MKGLWYLGLLVLAPTAVCAQFGLPVEVPKVPETTQLEPKGLPIPTAKDLLKPAPSVTTALPQAYPEVALFDDWQPKQVLSLVDLPQDADGNFQLKPGIYELDTESYSLQVGSHGPSKSSGYLSAPLLEDQNALIRTLLQQAPKFPDITQSQVQSLIWAIISRTEIKSLSQDLQNVAQQLLTSDAIKTLNQQALGLIPPDQRTEVFASLSTDVHASLDAQASMRAALTQQKSYKDLERIAVLSGNPKAEAKDRKVPTGRWSYHANGYFLRSLPSAYGRTEIQLAVPEQYQVKRDSMGRIVAIADTAGNRIETDYDDETQPLEIPDDPSTLGYAFQEIRFIRSTSKTAPPETVTLAKMGWTLMHKSQTSSRSRQLYAQSTLMASLASHVPGLSIAQATAPDVFEQWKKRYKQAEAQQKGMDEYLKRWQTSSGKQPTAKIQQLVDLQHYGDAIEAAIADDEWDQYEWLQDHQAKIFQALQSEIAALESKGQTPSLTFNPAETAAISGQSDRQILGLSSRPYQP